MHDKNGCIKVNIEGPDIILTPITVPGDMKAVMREQALVLLDSNPLEKPKKHAKSSVEEVKINAKVHDISQKQLRNRSKSSRNHSNKKRRQSRYQRKPDVPALYVSFSLGYFVFMPINQSIFDGDLNNFIGNDL